MLGNGKDCENCGMTLESEAGYKRHKDKFCINSKYADINTLNQQFASLSKGRDISKFSNPNLQGFNSPKNNISMNNTTNIDKEYRSLLKQIGESEDLRIKLEKERRTAEEELLNLQAKQKDVLVEAKRKDLIDINKKKEKLNFEEELLEAEIKKFQKERKEQSFNNRVNPNEDFIYQEGRQAGKIAMQRRLLEEKKREIQQHIRLKKRQGERLQMQLGKIQDIPIFIPQFKKKQPYSNSQVRRFDPQQQIVMEQITPMEHPSANRKNHSQKGNLPEKDNFNKYIKESKSQQLSQSVRIEPQVDDSLEQQFLRASRFPKDEKTLFESLNPKGKSDEDIFIETLVAQQYDALNLIARLPKQSPLYQVKLKQFQQMSKVRQEIKDKIQKVRLDKVKRQFEMEKQMTETEKTNLQWLDQNRKQILNRGVDIIQRHNREQNQHFEKQKNNEIRSGRINVINGSNKNINNFEGPSGSISVNSITANGPLQSATQNGSRGYRVTIKSVKNYQSKGPLSVKCIVLEEGDKNMKNVFMTKYHDEYASKDDRNPYNPAFKDLRDQFGNILFNESFQIPDDLQRMYLNNQNQIYLWLMLMQKDEEKISNQPNVYAWYCFKLTHFGQIREGTFTLSLYRDNITFPTPTDMNRIKDKAQQQITIELNQVIISLRKSEPQIQKPITSQHTNPKSASSMKRTLTNQNQSKRSVNSFKNIKIKQDYRNGQSVKDIKEEYFRSNQVDSEFSPVTLGEKLNLNISCVAIRTLPSYVGPINAEISILDQNSDRIIQKAQFLSDIDGDMYNPDLNFCYKVRNKELPPSSVIVIRLMALNVLNYEPGLLGFCFLHLFYNSEGVAIQVDGVKDFFMINGEFQIPLYWGNCQEYITNQSLTHTFAIIPCSSLLISISPRIESVQFPPYSSKRYNTIFFEVTSLQFRLFQEQYKREQQSTSKYIKAYFKFKGVNGYKEEDLKKLLNQSLSFKQENVSNMLLLNSLAEYSPTFGIVVNVDLISIPLTTTNYYYFCTICLSPPAKYYRDEENDLIFMYKIDLASSLTRDLLLADDSINYSPYFDQNTSIIIELMRIKLNESGSPDSSIETCAYGILPLFDQSMQFPCVDIGVHNLQLEDSEFEDKDIKSIQNNLKKHIENISSKKKSQFSILIRVMNGYFPTQFQGPRSGTNGKPLRSIFQNSKGFKNTQQSIRKIIETTYGVILD